MSIGGVMKCALFLFVILLFGIPGYADTQAPCVRKLLTTGDKAKDTASFIFYIHTLMIQRVLTPTDLEQFLDHLEKNQWVNPVPNRSELKFEIHYKEFQKILATWDLDLRKIKSEIRLLVNETETQASEKNKSEEWTGEIPSYIAPDGARFYKFNPPGLGDAYKILKPKGHYEIPRDWEKLVWPINAVKNSVGVLIRVKQVDAIKRCEELGPNIILPRKKDYERLMSHLGPKETRNSELLKILPDSNDSFWTSTISSDMGWRFGGGNGYSNYYGSINPLPFRCVGKK